MLKRSEDLERPARNLSDVLRKTAPVAATVAASFLLFSPTDAASVKCDYRTQQSQVVDANAKTHVVYDSGLDLELAFQRKPLLSNMRKKYMWISFTISGTGYVAISSKKPTVDIEKRDISEIDIYRIGRGLSGRKKAKILNVAAKKELLRCSDVGDYVWMAFKESYPVPANAHN